MTEYTCDGCTEYIPASKARLHCQDCPDHDVCANCYVTEVYRRNHMPDHQVLLFQVSGHCPTIPPPPPQQRPPLPSRPTEVESHQVPEVSQPSSAPPSQHRSVAKPNPQPTAPSYPPPPTAHTVPHPPSTPPIATQDATPKSGWRPLFEGTQASPCFVALLKDIFSRLDTGRRGILTPEQYSSFLDSQGYTLDQDVWKKSLQPTFGFNKEDLADYELRQTYDNFSIEYALQPRNQAPNTDFSSLTSSFAGLMGNGIAQAVQPKPISGGMMPCITLKGFIDIGVIETLYDPGAGWNQLNRALRAYGIWREWGDVPRRMLPDFPPQSLLDRVKRISEFAKLKAQNQLDAKRAELMLKQQGQQNALDLIDGPRYYYRY